MKNIDVSIVIVNYNAEEFLKECLDSLQKEVPHTISHEIIVVDNASSDGSVEMVRKNWKDVILIDSKENLGFSKANNLGVKKSGGRYVLFLNPDTVMQRGTMETMIEFMDSTDKAGAATCFVRLANGKLDDGAHRGYPTPWNAFCYFSGLAKLFPKSLLFNGYNLGFKDLDKVHEIDALVGAFMLVRRTAGDAVAWWDEDYFFYGEDLDFCYNLKKKGWKIFFVPDAEVLHYKGVTAGIKNPSKAVSTASHETRVRSTQERYKAMKTFYKKHYVKKYPAFITWLVFQGIDFKLRRSLKEITV